MGKKNIIRASMSTRKTVHHSRYIRHKLGMDSDQIAAADGVKPETVRESIAMIDAIRANNNLEFLTEAMIETLLDTTEGMKAALNRGFRAKQFLDAENGATVTREDHQTQLRAVEAFTELVSTIQPKPQKGSQTQVNVLAGAQASAPAVVSRTFGFEDRLRSIRQNIQTHNQLPSEVGNVIDPDADLEDAEEESSSEVTVVESQAT